MRLFGTVAAATALLLASTVFGCGYRAGSLIRVGPHGHVANLLRIGCLDVAVVPVIDSAARGPVAGFSFANRCDRSVVVDLRAVRATAISASGRRVPLQVYDPDRQIRRTVLDARARGHENLEYTMPPEIPPPKRLCLDLSRLNGSQGATPQRGPKVEVCIDAYVNHSPPTLAWSGP